MLRRSGSFVSAESWSSILRCLESESTPSLEPLNHREIVMTKEQEALQFILDIAEEEYPFQRANTGAELVLRHIIRKCTENLIPESDRPASEPTQSASPSDPCPHSQDPSGNA